MTYKAVIHISGFVPIEVEADSIKDAEKKIKNTNINTACDVGAVESVIFNTFEQEPKPVE